ncbi:MAG: PqqD family protein [Clostridia bacterium]|nr:PqqD family protein [Clostridia bacterium]
MEEKRLQPIEVVTDNPIPVYAGKRYMADDQYILREIGGECVLVCCVDNPKLGNSMLSLNESFAFLWKCYQEPRLLDEVLEMAKDEYDVDERILRRDLVNFLFQGVQLGLLKEI